jgi:hypothetical protein
VTESRVSWFISGPEPFEPLDWLGINIAQLYLLIPHPAKWRCVEYLYGDPEMLELRERGMEVLVVEIVLVT